MEEYLEYELPSTEYAEGFSYLYKLLSHLTSSKTLFVHKLNVMMKLSREISKSNFSRSEVEAMLPNYPTKVLDSIMNSLIDGGWLIREEGTLTYQFSKAGILFIRFLPFLYKGDELDSMAFQAGIKEILEAAERMKLDIFALEFLRDQAIHAVQRDIVEIESALISRNEERIYEISQRVDRFLSNVTELIERFKEFNNAKRAIKGEFSETDKRSLDVLNNLYNKINLLFDKKQERIKEATAMGEILFTKADMDRFLYSKNFHFLANIVRDIVFVPSNAKWVDEDDIVTALNVFLGRKKRLKKRILSTRVFGSKDHSVLTGKKTYIQKLEELLSQQYESGTEVDLAEFLQPLQDKVDVLMYLATICFLADKPVDQFTRLELEATGQYVELGEHPLLGVTKTTIKRSAIK